MPQFEKSDSDLKDQAADIETTIKLAMHTWSDLQALDDEHTEINNAILHR